MSAHGAVIDLIAAVMANDQAIAVVVAILAALAHYAKTGSLPLGRLPWRLFRRMLRDLRYQYFDRPRPTGVPGIITEEPPGEIDTLLRENHHWEGAPYSFYYEDEVENIRRPSGLRPNPETSEPEQMALHDRMFELADGRTLHLAHDEASRYEEQGLHLAEAMYSWERGQQLFADALDEAGITAEIIESEAGADVTVIPQTHSKGVLTRLLSTYIPTGG